MGVQVADLTEDEARDLERAAVIGIALASLPNEDEVRRLWAEQHGAEFPDLDTALAHLHALTAEGMRVSHRTLALRLLTKVAATRGTAPLAESRGSLATYTATHVMEAQGLLPWQVAKADRRRGEDKPSRRRRRRRDAAEAAPAEAAAAEPVLSAAEPPAAADAPGPPGPPLVSEEHPPEVQQVLRGLEDVAAATEEEPWDVFIRAAGEPLDLSDQELALPVCSDEEHVQVQGHDSTRVVTWFSTPRPASDFAAWTDARQWATKCSLFYEAVTPKQPIPQDSEEYSEVFTEVVRFTATKTLTTDLVFTRTVRPPNLYALQFDLPPGGQTKDILVDRGSLIARHDPDLPAEVATQITAEKCLAFADPAMASWPSLSCDLFWMELTITVALGCAQDP